MVKQYHNVLKDIKTEYNDFRWISRNINFKKTFSRGDRPQLSPTEIKLAVKNSSHLIETIKKVSKNNNDSHIKQQIDNILNEIAYEYDLSVIRWLGFLLIKILRKTLTGLYVNDDKLIKIKNIFGDSPVIFVPTHRSYGDFILMAFICFKYEINIPCVAAGMDFLSMKFMAKLLRKSKAFFLRRTFTNDPVYRIIFKEYIKTVIAHESSPVEFFIEGTRSRTGKSLAPKFGFLTILADLFITGDIPDLVFVPVNISYDKFLEEKLFAYELMGIPKPKESTTGMLKGMKEMKGSYGNVFVNFGEPFSIREYFQNVNDLRFYPTGQELEKVKILAHKIVQLQQSLQIFGTFNLLALVLHLSSESQTPYKIGLMEAIAEMIWLKGLFTHFGANVHLDGMREIESSIKETIKIHSSLVELDNNRFITVKAQNHNILNKNSTREDYMRACIPFILLQIYINPAICTFVRASMIVIILEHVNNLHATTKDVLFINYKNLWSILKNEFIFDGKNENDFLCCISDLRDLKVINIKDPTIELLLPEKPFSFFKHLIMPFIKGMFEVCLIIKKFQNEINGNLFSNVHKILRLQMEEEIKTCPPQYFYSSSADFISNSLNSLLDLQVLAKNERSELIVSDVHLLKMITEYLGCFVNHKYLDSHNMYFSKCQAFRPKL